jgi:ABC-2 type transport system ATP-binding protein
MLTLEHVNKTFGGHVAVRDLSLSVAPKEIYALVGPNGSGKTTIIRLIAGLLAPSAGHILVGGADVVRRPDDARARIGYIPDEPAAWPGMTGVELLHFVGALYGVPPRSREERIPELLRLFSLEETANGQFAALSRGNRQKISILAAFLHHPELLLIDEPIVGLDPESAAIAKARFVDLARAGSAVLMVTHTLPVAEEIATRIGVLVQGRLVAEGSMEEIRQRAGRGGAATLEECYAALAGHAADRT